VPAPDPVVSWIVALGVGLLFAVSVLHKLRDWPRFVGALEAYRLLPAKVVPLAAATIVVLELSAACALPVPAARAFGAAVAAALLCAYAAAIGINLRRGRTAIDCGCVGFGRRQRIHRGLVVRNVLLAASLALALAPAARALTALDVLTICGALLAAVVLYLAVDALAAIAPNARSAS
jgi:hypothetical protein